MRLALLAGLLLFAFSPTARAEGPSFRVSGGVFSEQSFGQDGGDVALLGPAFEFGVWGPRGPAFLLVGLRQGFAVGAGQAGYMRELRLGIGAVNCDRNGRLCGSFTASGGFTSLDFEVDGVVTEVGAVFIGPILGGELRVADGLSIGLYLEARGTAMGQGDADEDTQAFFGPSLEEIFNASLGARLAAVYSF